MFLKEGSFLDVSYMDKFDSEHLQKRIKYRRRFKGANLGQLVVEAD